MKRNFSKRVAPVVLAISMMVNSTGVSALAATGTVSDPVLGEESSEANESSSKRAYEKVSKEENEKIFDTASPSNATKEEEDKIFDATSPSYATASPSDATRISSDIMPISEDTTRKVDNYMDFREALMDSRYDYIDTVILDDDIVLYHNGHNEYVAINKNATIDLNGHKIISNGADSYARTCLEVYDGKELILKNGTISSEALGESDVLVVVQGKLITEKMKFETNDGYAIALREVDSEVTLSADSSIENKNGTGIAADGAGYHYIINVEGKISVQGDHPAIIGKEETTGTDINIKEGAEITGGIVQMSGGDVVIEGGAEIESGQQGSAVSITKGNLTVQDGATIKATSLFETYEPGDGGDLHDGGSAIFVEPSGAVNVTIEGGTITSAEGPAFYAPKADNSDLNLRISGGTFEGNTAEQGAVTVNGLKEFISSGAYNTDIDQYVADNEMVIKVTHSGETWSYVGDDAAKMLEELVSGDTVEFQGLGNEKEFDFPVGVIVTNHTGEDITVNGTELPEGNTVTVEAEASTPTHSGGSSSSSEDRPISSDSSSSDSSSSEATGLANTWSYDAVRDKWTYDNKRYKNRWVYLFNPYAVQGKGQYDWFFFDENGEMITGWFTDADGLTYYLNETSDGTSGCMVTGWNWIADASGKKKCYYFSEIPDGTRGHLFRGSITPDGYAVDTTGAWVVDGKVVER